ncbi:ABC transporter permease, partial [candidate division KSB1 bacterium]|nr:ABC transporter permease [candidate division KSB1 bacterium]
CGRTPRAGLPRATRDDKSLQQEAQQYGQMPKMNVNEQAIRPLLGNIATIAMLLLPGITMRLLAEEKRQGTMEFLLTAPLTNGQLVFAKFTSALLFYLTMLAATALLVGLLFFYGKPELNPILTGYLGLFLLGGGFIAVGLFFSAMTENQIIAFVSTFATNLAIYFAAWFGNMNDAGFGKIFSMLSPFEHFEDFAKGVLDTKHVVFYLSFIFGWLFLTYVILESSRWRGFQGKRINIALPVSAAELAKALGRKVEIVVEKGRAFGVTTQEHAIADKNVAVALALQFGYDAEVTKQ